MQMKLKEGVMILNKGIYLLFLLFLPTCFGYQEADYCKIADQIVNSYVREFAQPRGLRLSAYGGAMMGDIQKITMGFSSFDALDTDKARTLFVDLMEEFLSRINCYKKIHPYLHTFPFEKNNIKLSISFVDLKGHNIADGHVALMGIRKNGTLYYAAYNNDIKEFYDLHQENYIEALQKVCNNK
jgi:hypothetical protein